MAITSIMRDWGTQPCIVRITTTDTLAAITTAGYLTAQAPYIAALNNGAFEYVEGALYAVNFSDGEGFFTVDSSDMTFVAEVDPGQLSETLQSARIFVGSAGNVATGVALSGDATMANTGAITIAANAVTTAKILDANVTVGKLAVALQPSHVVKFAGQHTTVGGAAAEAIAVVGALDTDLAFVQVVDQGTGVVTVLKAVVTADTLTVTFSADPLADAIVNYQIMRAIA